MIVPKAGIFSKVLQIRIFLAVMTVIVIAAVIAIPIHYSAAQPISEPYGAPYGISGESNSFESLGMQATPSYVVELSEIDFDQTVAGPAPVLVTFWAPSCGPCQDMIPIVEQVAMTYGSNLLFGRVNVDDNPGIAMRYQVSALPTFIVFKNGMPVDGVVGSVGEMVLDDLAYRNQYQPGAAPVPAGPSDFGGGVYSGGNSAPLPAGPSDFGGGVYSANPLPYTGPP